MFEPPDDSGHRPPAFRFQGEWFPDNLLDRLEGEGHGEGEAEEGAEGVIHDGNPFLQVRSRVVTAPGEKDHASPLEPDTGELLTDQGREARQMEEAAGREGGGIEETRQTALDAEEGIAVHDPDEDPAPADADRLGDRPGGVFGELQRGNQGDNVEFIVGEGEIFRPAPVEIGAVFELLPRQVDHEGGGIDPRHVAPLVQEQAIIYCLLHGNCERISYYPGQFR